MAFQILSLSGGGICGLIELYILKRLTETCPQIIANTDLLAGTSTGGLIALGLAQGNSLDDLIALYETKGFVIFDKARFGVGGLVHCRYDNRNYRKLLWGHFGDRRLADLKKRVLVPTVRVSSSKARGWRPKIYVNYPDTEEDRAALCVSVALKTSAAPTYFPISDYHIDGGVCANNPAMCALASALSIGIEITDIKMLSLGSGLFPQSVNSQDGNWGLVQWGTKLVDIMLGGSEQIPDYQCRHILRDRYLRVNPVTPKGIAMDDWKGCDKLKKIAMEYDLTEAVDWVGREWKHD